MNQLPTELIRSVLLATEAFEPKRVITKSSKNTPTSAPILSILDLVQLASTNRNLRNIIRERSFGSQYLAATSVFVQRDLLFHTPVGNMDAFYFGIDHDNNVFLLQTCPEENILRRCVWTLSDSGGTTCSLVIRPNPSPNGVGATQSLVCRVWNEISRPKSDDDIGNETGSNAQEDLLEDIWWNERQLAVLVPETHMRECTICKSVNPKWLFRPIDKNFRVFHRTWSDKIQFRLPNGSMVHLSIVHRGAQNGFQELWDSLNTIETISTSRQEAFVMRYGLRTSRKQIRDLERFFQLRDDPRSIEGSLGGGVDSDPNSRRVSEDADSSRNDTLQGQPVYNPWV